jgi:hypothetical protein
VADGEGRGGEGNGGLLLKLLGAAVALVTLVGGGVTLLFQLRPDLQPCIGGSSAEFTGAPVFPQSVRDFLLSENKSKQDVASVPSDLDGVEIRFSYRADNLKDSHLRFYSSLVTVGHGGEVNGVVTSENRQLQLSITPNTCSQSSGKDAFVLIPDHTKRYRLVLELYKGATFDNRLALYETPTFQG